MGRFRIVAYSQDAWFEVKVNPRGALPYWQWRGRAAGQGMIFTVIHIDKGYLNRPNWLLAGNSFYHRIASRASQPGSQPTMFMTSPRYRHQRRRERDATYFYECMMIHSRIESQSVPVQGMHMKVLVRYIARGHSPLNWVGGVPLMGGFKIWPCHKPLGAQNIHPVTIGGEWANLSHQVIWATALNSTKKAGEKMFMSSIVLSYSKDLLHHVALIYTLW